MVKLVKVGGKVLTLENGLPPSFMKIMDCVAILQQQCQPVTLRSIARLYGKSAYFVLMQVDKLVAAGLLCKEPRMHVTIRPTCRFIPADQIAPNRRSKEN